MRRRLQPREYKMEQNPLRDDLLRLHKELSKINSLDAESQELLVHLKNDIQKVLEHRGENMAAPHGDLLKGLTESSRYFELSHPHLLAIVNNIIATLNNLGI